MILYALTFAAGVLVGFVLVALLWTDGPPERKARVAETPDEDPRPDPPATVPNGATAEDVREAVEDVGGSDT